MTLLFVHIAAGVLALVFGYVALFATKGARLHRRSGRLFVYAMVALSLSAVVLAALKGSSINLVAGLMTFYFVTTALLTVLPRVQQSRWLDPAAMLFALVVSVLAFKVGADSASTGRPEAGPMLVFGAVGLLAALGDARMIRARSVQGARRIKRHLWRMCFAMWVAAASFFWGPPGRVPEVIYYPALLPIPVLTPVVVMLYWLWRLRARRSARAGRLDNFEATYLTQAR